LETEFEGKLSFEGAVRVDGKFSGEVRSNGTFIIGEKGIVRADIQAGVVMVRGEVHGTINASNRIEAYSPAKIYAEIYSPILVFGEGVIFQGTSHMSGDFERIGKIESSQKNQTE
jgi:cytoskeletal protein CcmA (bactofilin family)